MAGNSIISNTNISIGKAASISSILSENNNSISSLNINNSKSFVNNITTPIGSAIQDPVKAVLSKTLTAIANTTNLAEKSINDLQSQLNSYVDKNSQVKIIGNNIVITVTSNDISKGQAEQKAIESKINSIKNILNTLQKTISTLNTITKTISVLLLSLTVMESLIAVNPIAKTAYTVFKQAIKVVFLKDMLNSYSTVIENQLSQSTNQLSQFLEKFMNLQVNLNIQDSANKGENITVEMATSNIAQKTLGGEDLINQNQSFTSLSGKKFILTVIKQNDNQLIGKAVEAITGLLAVQTAPSFISSPDDLINEMKSILNIT